MRFFWVLTVALPFLFASRCFAEGPATLRKSDISGLLIKLEIDGKTAYYVMMDSDGSINRQGSIRKSESNSDLYIGVVPKDLFNRLLAHVDDSLLREAGRRFELKGAR